MDQYKAGERAVAQSLLILWKEPWIVQFKHEKEMDL